MKNHSAVFHDFEENPTIVAKLIEQVLREKDGPNAASKPNEKAGALMGFLCEDLVRGGTVIVGSSTLIEQAMKTAKEGTVFGIEFHGKKQSTTDKSRSINSFSVVEAENEKEVEQLLKKYADKNEDATA